MTRRQRPGDPNWTSYPAGADRTAAAPASSTRSQIANEMEVRRAEAELAELLARSPNPTRYEIPPRYQGGRRTPDPEGAVLVMRKIQFRLRLSDLLDAGGPALLRN